MNKRKNKSPFDPFAFLKRAVFNKGKPMEMGEQHIHAETIQKTVDDTTLRLENEVELFDGLEPEINTDLYENANRFANGAIKNLNLYATEAVNKIKGLTKWKEGDISKDEAIGAIVKKKDECIKEINKIKERFLVRRKIIQAQTTIAANEEGYIKEYKDKHGFSDEELRVFVNVADALEKGANELAALKAEGLEKEQEITVAGLREQANIFREKAKEEMLLNFGKEIAEQANLIASVEKEMDNGKPFDESKVMKLAGYEKNLLDMKATVAKNFPDEPGFMSEIDSQVTKIADIRNEMEKVNKLITLNRKLEVSYANLEKARKAHEAERSASNYSWLTGAEKTHNELVREYEKFLKDNNIDLSKAVAKRPAVEGATRYASFLLKPKESKEFDPDEITSRLNTIDAKKLHDLKEKAEQEQTKTAWRAYNTKLKELANSQGINVPDDYLEDIYRANFNKMFRKKLSEKDRKFLTELRKTAVDTQNERLWKKYVDEVNELSAKFNLTPPGKLAPPWESEKLLAKKERPSKKRES